MIRAPQHLVWTALVSALAVTTVLATAGIASPAAPSPSAVAGAGWTGTWASAPQNGGSSFSQQTIRQIVHTSIGGTVARIRLSNAFGSKPLTVNDVHLAQAGSGSSIVSGSDHPVTFGGSTSITIPAGGTGLSDTAYDSGDHLHPNNAGHQAIGNSVNLGLFTH